jgi:hypothetical protein
MKNKTLFVISVISNTARYQSRVKLFKQFEQHMKDSPHVHLITVEMCFGDRPYEVTEANNPNHVQLKSYDELWHKENMINIGIKQLYKIAPDWEYVAWIDADIHFPRHDWALETMHKLQHFMVLQLFSSAVDLGPKHEVLQVHKGFVWCWQENRFEPDLGGIISNNPYNKKDLPAKYYWHPGYAWAARREAMEALRTHSTGPLIDFPCIIGAGDHHMALAMIGLAERSVPTGLHPNYLKAVLQWQKNALDFVKKDIGYLDCTILHYWHGKKAERRYWQRWDILKNNEYDPETDIRRDNSSMMSLVVQDERQRRLRDHLRHYFQERNEDSIDM